MGDCCDSCRKGGACESGCQGASAPRSAGLGDPPHKRATRVNTQGHPVAGRASGDPPGEELIFGIPRATWDRMSPEAQERAIRREYEGDQARMNAALVALRNGVDTFRTWFEGEQRNRQEQIRQDAETRRTQIEQDAETERRYIEAERRRNPELPPPPPPPPPAQQPPATATGNGTLYLVGGLALLAVVYAVTRSTSAARPTPNPDPPRMASGHGRCPCGGRKGSYYDHDTRKFARCPCRGG